MCIPFVLPFGSLGGQVEALENTRKVNPDGQSRVAEQVVLAVRRILARVVGVNDEGHLARKEEAARDRSLLIAELVVEGQVGANVVGTRRIEESLCPS